MAATLFMCLQVSYFARIASFLTIPVAGKGLRVIGTTLRFRNLGHTWL